MVPLQDHRPQCMTGNHHEVVRNSVAMDIIIFILEKLKASVIPRAEAIYLVDGVCRLKLLRCNQASGTSPG